LIAPIYINNLMQWRYWWWCTHLHWFCWYGSPSIPVIYIDFENMISACNSYKLHWFWEMWSSPAKSLFWTWMVMWHEVCNPNPWKLWRKKMQRILEWGVKTSMHPSS
jgi:hypothetical protein